jgi:hypothetical protein
MLVLEANRALTDERVGGVEVIEESLVIQTGMTVPEPEIPS